MLPVVLEPTEAPPDAVVRRTFVGETLSVLVDEDDAPLCVVPDDVRQLGPAVFAGLFEVLFVTGRQKRLGHKPQVGAQLHGHLLPVAFVARNAPTVSRGVLR